MHGPRYKPGDSFWLHSSVNPKGLSPKLSSPWKGPYTIVQCLNDVTYKIKNTANQKETIVHYDRTKPFVQRPEELQPPRREPSLPRVPESKSAQKPHSAIHKHCNCSQTVQTKLQQALDPEVHLQPHFQHFLSPKLPYKDLLLRVQNEPPWFPAEPLFVVHLEICLKFHRKQNLQL